MVPHAWACLRFVPTAGLATVQIGTTGSRLNFSCEIPEVVVPALDALLARARGEYREMPGLQLTISQACRLWQLEQRVCEHLFQMLASEGFVVRTKDDAFMASSASY